MLFGKPLKVKAFSHVQPSLEKYEVLASFCWQAPHTCFLTTGMDKDTFESLLVDAINGFTFIRGEEDNTYFLTPEYTEDDSYKVHFSTWLDYVDTITLMHYETKGLIWRSPDAWEPVITNCNYCGTNILAKISFHNISFVRYEKLNVKIENFTQQDALSAIMQALAISRTAPVVQVEITYVSETSAVVRRNIFFEK